MKRAFAVATFVALAVAGLAGPALAKGENQTITASAVITGPGIDRPIKTGGTIHGFLFSEQTQASAIGTLVRRSGLMGFTEQGSGYYTIAPDTSKLGPKYEISFTLDLPDTTNPIVEDLYPYASEGPMVFAHSAQHIEGARVPSAWYVAPGALLSTLVELGLPKTAPAVPAPVVPAPRVPVQPPAVRAPAHEPVSVPSGSIWPWAIAVMGLASLVVLGAVAGRRARLRFAG